MTELAYIYTKRRKEFGKNCKFSAVQATILETILKTDSKREQYVKKNPVVSCLDTATQMSEHEVNTERVVMKNSSMRHIEGGWAKEVDPGEQSDTSRFRKKAEKDEEFRTAVRNLVPLLTKCMRQNATVDIYEEYFTDCQADHSRELPSAKGLASFKDPRATHGLETSSHLRRAATSIDWHPEAGRIAVTYCNLGFQEAGTGTGGTIGRVPTQSYVWDISNSNAPEYELAPPSPLCCLKFNPKSPDTLVGGCYNGLIVVFDLRRATGQPGTTRDVSPMAVSSVETSHFDPVRDISWISSKTGSQCVSVSTDGRILWWDTRKLTEPSDSVSLFLDAKAECAQLQGGCTLEYSTEAGPSKYLVGTEQGAVILINLKSRKQNGGVAPFDVSGPGKHHGPVCSVRRNPSNPKCFLSVGDWTARVWTEDIKTPVASTPHHQAVLTAGCWSPSRPGVFLLARADGVLDVWDYLTQQTAVTYSHKVGDAPLSSISVQQPGGRLVAVGDAVGTVTLLELCDSLSTPQPGERRSFELMLDREARQEKGLEARERELRRRAALGQTGLGHTVSAKSASSFQPSQINTHARDEETEALLRRVDASFLAMVKEGDSDEGPPPHAHKPQSHMLQGQQNMKNTM